MDKFKLVALDALKGFFYGVFVLIMTKGSVYNLDLKCVVDAGSLAAIHVFINYFNKNNNAYGFKKKKNAKPTN